jgi:hypothetical protein
VGQFEVQSVQISLHMQEELKDKIQRNILEITYKELLHVILNLLKRCRGMVFSESLTV